MAASETEMPRLAVTVKKQYRFWKSCKHLHIPNAVLVCYEVNQTDATGILEGP